MAGKNREPRSLYLNKNARARARKFLAYIEKHRHRLIDYELLQTEYQISIGEASS